jgi:amidase
LKNYFNSIGRRDFIKLTAGVSAAQITGLGPAYRAFAQTLPTEITEMSATQLSMAIKAGKVSCVEVMQAYLERIHNINPVYNVIVSMVEDDYLVNQAKLADQALSKNEYGGWMHGMPHAVKDLANARGLETSYGSPLHAGTIAQSDDIHISRIRGQGAIFIG